jgi:hypothetical protein
MINWIKLKDKKPEDGQLCLTKMKHGIISGFYNVYSLYCII